MKGHKRDQLKNRKKNLPFTLFNCYTHGNQVWLPVVCDLVVIVGSRLRDGFRSHQGWQNGRSRHPAGSATPVVLEGLCFGDRNVEIGE